MDQNEGKATLRQILEDICIKAGVNNNITEFDGENIETGYVDSTITGTTYISYIAEQCGCIPIINRSGELEFVNLNNATTWRIPLSIMSDNYEVEDAFNIERVVYESGIIKYETSNDTSLSTLYINSANPFVVGQTQVDNILEMFEDFSIDSVSLTQSILGNPAIDPWDMIEVYDDYNNDETIFKTLANTSYIYNGKHKDLFVTKIGKEERKENVTLKSEATYKKNAKTTIDNINAEIILQAENTREVQENVNELQTNLEENYYPKSTVEQ